MNYHEQLERAYEVIEYAAEHKTPVELPDDIRLETVMRGPGHFLIKGLYWIDDERNVYQAVLEPATRRTHDYLPGMYLWGTNNLDGMSSGDTSMIRKENRYKTII